MASTTRIVHGLGAMYNWPTDRELMGTLAPEEQVMIEEWGRKGIHTEHPLYLSSKEGVEKRMRRARIEKNLATVAWVFGSLGCVVLLVVMVFMAFR